MEVLQESIEKHKGSVFEPDFEKETLALTLINLLQSPIGPSLGVLADEMMVELGRLGL